MELSLGFSPCPNDTFIFDAMIHGKVDTEGLSFRVVMEDVEALNQAAFRGDLAITKLSYHAFAYTLEQYALLHSGSALGNNCGPLLIAQQAMDPTEIRHVGIPGKYTTANFLLSLAFPELTDRREMLFSEIEQAVVTGSVDAGLIIHENRFTYQDKGLVKLLDLGEYWETTTQLPIPLGGIVIKRELDPEIQQKVNRVLHRSVQFALQHPEQTMSFVSQYAQEMQQEVMLQHISLYVNDYTLDLGDKGRQAVEKLFAVANEKGVIPVQNHSLFI